MKNKLYQLAAISILVSSAFLPLTALAQYEPAPGTPAYQAAQAQVPAAQAAAATTCPGGGQMVNGTTCNLGYTQLEPIPGLVSQTGAGLVNPNNLHNIINAIFKIIITVGALIAVLSLTLGGVQYMVSGSSGGKNAGRKRAEEALWAILLIAASWLILNTINPALLNFSLNPCPQGGTTCTITSSASNLTSASIPTEVTQLSSAQISGFPSGTLLNNEAVIFDPAHPDAGIINQVTATCAAQKGVMVGTPLGVNGQSAEVCMNPSSPNYGIYNSGMPQS
jgi:hypothetical protein